MKKIILYIVISLIVGFLVEFDILKESAAIGALYGIVFFLGITKRSV